MTTRSNPNLHLAQLVVTAAALTSTAEPKIHSRSKELVVMEAPVM